MLGFRLLVGNIVPIAWEWAVLMLSGYGLIVNVKPELSIFFGYFPAIRAINIHIS